MEFLLNTLDDGMKKITLLLSLVSLLMANAVHAEWESNALMGISGGYEWRRSDVNVEVDILTTPIIAFKHPLNDNGFMWGLFAGYQWHCNGWVLGGELSFSWDNNDKNHNTTLSVGGVPALVSTNYDRGLIVGVSGRWGYEIVDLLLGYVRLGLESSKDRLSVTGILDGQTLAADGKRRPFRPFVGAGAEIPIPLWLGLSMRAEYNYHFKGKSVLIEGATDGNPVSVFANSKPIMHTVFASVVWNFI